MRVQGRARPSLTVLALAAAMTFLVQRPAARAESDRHTAPDTLPDQKMLVRITLNGLDQGEQIVWVTSDGVTLPPDTLHALHLAAKDQANWQLRAEDGVRYNLDIAGSALSLDLPASRFEIQRFAPDAPTLEVKLSPETWGAYVDYDINVRSSFAGARAGATLAFGGLADLRLLGPDLQGSFGFAYDSASSRPGAGPIRLDSLLTWRPANDNLAVSAGDLLPRLDSLAATRAYRYFGLQVGTDFSAAIGWSSAPIVSVAGSAQAQSVLDLYINGQRTYSATTPGGPFALTLPPGASGGSTSLVVTDVTGRQLLVPVEIPRVDAQLLRNGLLLWSAGVGAPRFGFGTESSAYQPDLYGYASARFGAYDQVTLRTHGEFGADLAEVELGADGLLGPDIALHGTLAFSHSDRGPGASLRFAATLLGPWGLSLDARAAKTIGHFDDVVSASGRRYALQHQLNPLLTLPANSEFSARLAWQLTERLGLSASYQRNRYPGSGPAGIASLSANFQLGGLPLFANAFHTFGARPATSVIAGISFQLGPVQASASSGASFQPGDLASLDQRLTSSFSAAQPLAADLGAFGWSAYGTRDQNGLIGNAQGEYRTGYAIPGFGVQTFGRSVTATATLRGSAGIVGWHPFVADPVQGGLIVVDTGQSGVPVQLDGSDRGRTAWDGKITLPAGVPGVPHHVAIDTTDLPIDTVPTITEGDATVRDGAATVVPFRVQTTAAAASFRVVFGGEAPPAGSTVVSAGGSAPVGNDGRAYLPSIQPGEVLRVDMPDGRTCSIATHFNGRGGLGRRLGPLPCRENNG